MRIPNIALIALLVLCVPTQNLQRVCMNVQMAPMQTAATRNVPYVLQEATVQINTRHSRFPAVQALTHWPELTQDASIALQAMRAIQLALLFNLALQVNIHRSCANR